MTRTPRGRGAPTNPPSRFERLEIESLEPVPAKIPTQFLRDASRTVIARNVSPDVGFDASIKENRPRAAAVQRRSLASRTGH